MSIQEHGYLQPTTGWIDLPDGTKVRIRPVLPADGLKIQAFVERLSPESRYFRFLEYINGITIEEANRLAAVDTHSEMAYAATREESGEEEIIGIARYVVIDDGEPTVAEVGVVVEDQYQNQGIGSRLISRLIEHARKEGIETFAGMIHPTNELILKIIEGSGFPVSRRYNSGLWEVDIDIR